MPAAQGEAQQPRDLRKCPDNQFKAAPMEQAFAGGYPIDNQDNEASAFQMARQKSTTFTPLLGKR